MSLKAIQDYLELEDWTRTTTKKKGTRGHKTVIKIVKGRNVVEKYLGNLVT